MRELEFNELLPLMESISKLYYMSVDYDCKVEDTDSEKFHKGGCVGLFVDINAKLMTVIEERNRVGLILAEEDV